MYSYYLLNSEMIMTISKINIFRNLFLISMQRRNKSEGSELSISGVFTKFSFGTFFSPLVTSGLMAFKPNIALV